MCSYKLCVGSIPTRRALSSVGLAVRTRDSQSLNIGFDSHTEYLRMSETEYHARLISLKEW